MENLLNILIIVGIYIVLTQVVLPKLGIRG